MTLTSITVTVDEDDLALVKQAAKRERRPEAELIREAFHLVAMRRRLWDTPWHIPTLDFNRALSAEDGQAIVIDEMVRRQHR
ncbi:ribbon-helix-helix protein, CopG family [Mycolicibacterium brumae]|uniref:Ribbon-helix-helix protein, CopG family n=1 Tax=Mycolicibacterium brumae TaxID=85968 RepID=A0A2G5P5T9_9MYCO|nr:ribbon-helix-helix protein, CopG family [Mycolicibacterium brumae]MCV7191524.1 ribbon-helix-helix protein, CopG family [Mycolicibacterium brumae]PIB73626.1 ribbon-helix-helix protein, CopG family [Mycolicibacterium brumae]RWA16238.1 hypothetical protein MBRU_09010 [Mycolicibacterium brumae DSM 44177]UWW09369.1 ribbon-helix-helix protein, CopG family [Mycolicibacterium brumae]